MAKKAAKTTDDFHLELSTLNRLDENLEADVNALINSAVADCRSRPGIMTPRTVQVPIRIAPHPDDPDRCHFWAELSMKVPPRKYDTVVGTYTNQGQLLFDWAMTEEEQSEDEENAA